MDRLKALEIFQAVADRGSFVKAADSLDLSTAVVSRSVQDLERLLGVRLLQRTTRRVSLTPDGADVLQRARGLLDSYEALAAVGDRSATELSGDIRFTGPASFSTWLMPILATFTERHPKVRLQFLATDSPMDLVAERIDLALRITRALPESLVARRIADVPLGVYASPDYLSRRGKPRQPDDLQGHDCLVHSSTGREATWPFLHPVTRQRSEPSVHGLLWSNNAEALMTAAIRGSGLALLPQALVRDAVQRGDLQQVLGQWPSPPLGMYLAYTSRRNQHARIRRLIEHLSTTLADLMDSERSTPRSPPSVASTPLLAAA